MSKKQPLISVVIPTYKRSGKLERAILSVEKQTYKNVEIIVVDDNAEFQDCRKTVEEIVKNHPKVRLIQNNKNLGGALSRNNGVKKSNGDFIAFLDDDDEYRKDKLEKQLKQYIKRNDSNIGLIFCNNDWVDFNKNIFYQHMCKILATTSNWFIPKKVIEGVGYFENTPNEQDTIMLLKILGNGYSVDCVREDLVVRTRHDSESGISGIKPKNAVGINNLRNWCRKYYSELDNKQQIRKVEQLLSCKLVANYVYNNKISKAWMELFNMIRNKPFDSLTAKSFIKVCSAPLFRILRPRK